MLNVSMRNKGLWLAVALIPALALAFSAHSILPVDPEPFGGVWVESSVQDCDAGKVCVVWEYSNGTLSDDPPCCVRESLVAAGDFAACGPSFRHQH